RAVPGDRRAAEAGQGQRRAHPRRAPADGAVPAGRRAGPAARRAQDDRADPGEGDQRRDAAAAAERAEHAAVPGVGADGGAAGRGRRRPGARPARHPAAHRRRRGTADRAARAGRRDAPARPRRAARAVVRRAGLVPRQAAAGQGGPGRARRRAGGRAAGRERAADRARRHRRGRPGQSRRGAAAHRPGRGRRRRRRLGRTAAEQAERADHRGGHHDGPEPRARPAAAPAAHLARQARRHRRDRRHERPDLADAAGPAPAGPGDVRGPAWPVAALLLGYPLWWALGFGGLSWVVLAVPMAVILWRRRPVRVPPGFGLWVLLLAGYLLSGLMLGEMPPGTYGEYGARRLVGYGMRFALYVSALILVLYLGNLTERELPQLRLVRMLG